MGNPFCHVDLATDDISAAKKFYKSVFDWTFSDTPDMRWTAVKVGAGVGGGIGKKQMPNQPSAWTSYVGVADVKKTIAKAQKAGATVIVPYMSIGDMGAIGVFIDPQGATLGVWEEAKKPAAKKASTKKPAAKPAAKAAAKKPAAKKSPAKKAARK